MNGEKESIERALEQEQRMMQRQALLKQLWKLNAAEPAEPQGGETPSKNPRRQRPALQAERDDAEADGSRRVEVKRKIVQMACATHTSSSTA